MPSDASSAPTDSNRLLKARFGSFFAALRARDQARRDLTRLSQMPDHMLSDIGLTRADVRHVRRTPVHRL
jgi:uncharacterized protein YjiS (DUF1127 family)